MPLIDLAKNILIVTPPALFYCYNIPIVQLTKLFPYLFRIADWTPPLASFLLYPLILSDLLISLPFLGKFSHFLPISHTHLQTAENKMRLDVSNLLVALLVVHEVRAGPLRLVKYASPITRVGRALLTRMIDTRDRKRTFPSARRSKTVGFLATGMVPGKSGIPRR